MQQATADRVPEPVDGQIVHLNPEQRIIQLEIENQELTRKLADADNFARMLAQNIFWTNDFARKCAANGVGFADEETSFRHWQNNGGPAAFDRTFPTMKMIRHHFAMCRSVRTRLDRLVH